MGDSEGPIVAQTVYETLFRESTGILDADDVSYAVDSAVTLLRRQGMHPSLWATYMHIGI